MRSSVRAFIRIEPEATQTDFREDKKGALVNGVKVVGIRALSGKLLDRGQRSAKQNNVRPL